jgi:PII-like signaling protein
MLRPGLAKKVTIHLNEDTASKRDFLYTEIFSFLYQRGVAGATLLRPDAGFGAHHRMHQSDNGPAAGEHMPIRIEFIETTELVAELMPQLCELLSDGLIEVQDTTVYKGVLGGGGQLEPRP